MFIHLYNKFTCMKNNREINKYSFKYQKWQGIKILECAIAIYACDACKVILTLCFISWGLTIRSL